MEKEPVKLNHSLIKETIPVFRYKLNIGEFYHNSSELDEMLSSLEDASEHDILEIDIHSFGGSSDELHRFVNIIQDKFYGRITTKLNPFGLSAGAFLFLQGNTRIVYENSYAMFHDASLGMSGKHSDLKTQAKFNELYIYNIVLNTIEPFFSETEITELFNGKEFWFDAFEMCKRNIATHISIFNRTLTSEEYVNAMSSEKTKKDFYNDLISDELISDRDKLRITKKLEKL